MRRFTALLAIQLATIPLADAATLKPYTRLTGPVVRLSDLWDGVEHDKPLGPAPAPGERIIVPTAQLSAIAHDFGVDWVPASSGERAILERPARNLTSDDVKPALLRALVAAGAGADAELGLDAFTAPPMPAEGKLDVAVAQLQFDQQNGRFSALLTVTTADAAASKIRLTGRMQDMLSVPVLRRRLMPGDVVAADDLVWARVPKTLARGEIVRQPADAVGLTVRLSPSPNQPIRAADLGREVVVHRGDAILVSLDTPGLSLAARGVATEPGGRGDNIRVLNPISDMTFEARITGSGTAHVIPGTARPANRRTAQR